MDLHNELKCLIDEGKSQDEILNVLASKGLSITDAIAAIRTLYSIKLDEAKKIVATSRHWEKVHRDHESFHEALEAYADMCQNQTRHT